MSRPASLSSAHTFAGRALQPDAIRLLSDMLIGSEKPLRESLDVRANADQVLQCYLNAFKGGALSEVGIEVQQHVDRHLQTASALDRLLGAIAFYQTYTGVLTAYGRLDKGVEIEVDTDALRANLVSCGGLQRVVNKLVSYLEQLQTAPRQKLIKVTEMHRALHKQGVQVEKQWLASASQQQERILAESESALLEHADQIPGSSPHWPIITVPFPRSHCLEQYLPRYKAFERALSKYEASYTQHLILANATSHEPQTPVTTAAVVAVNTSQVMPADEVVIPNRQRGKIKVKTRKPQLDSHLSLLVSGDGASASTAATSSASAVADHPESHALMHVIYSEVWDEVAVKSLLQSTHPHLNSKMLRKKIRDRRRAFDKRATECAARSSQQPPPSVALGEFTRPPLSAAASSFLAAPAVPVLNLASEERAARKLPLDVFHALA